MTFFETLQDTIRGDLYTDMFRRHLLATDGSIFKQVPCAAAYPKDTGDVVEIVKFAKTHNLTVHARGTGSGVCGAALGRGIIVDFSKYMNQLVHLDITNRTFECQPGFRMGELNEMLAGSNLYFPPDPSSGEYASFGGMYATNASGSRSAKYGNVGDYCLDAEIVTAKGEVVTLSGIAHTMASELLPPFSDLFHLYSENKELIETAYPKVRYNSSGYNLRGLVSEEGHLHLAGLFSGAEGTLGLVTRLTFRLAKKNPHDILVVAYFNDITASARATQEILPSGPNSIEIMDKSLLDLARISDPNLDQILPNGLDNLLLIAFDEAREETCRTKADQVEHLLKDKGFSDRIHIAFSESEKAKFWSIRKAAVPILYKMKGDKKVLALIEDATVPTDQLVPYFHGIYKILDELGVQFVLFGHISKGLLHTRPLLNLKQKKDNLLLKTISDRIFELVKTLGGAISGEHGDGRIRSVYIRSLYPKIFHLFEQVKELLDPDHLLNPDILTGAVPDPDAAETDVQNLPDAYRFASLRYGPEYRSTNPYDNILFPPDTMTREIEKCHGCSKCTTVTHASRMCPVYKVLRDEAAAPKAKANILRSLISGSFEQAVSLQEGTEDEQGFARREAYARGIFHVLDHCIACGSCSHECPSEVDIPGLVMEARANFKKRFGISLSDHLLTSVENSARLARPFAAIAGPLLENRPLRKFMEKVTGISHQRRIDPFSAHPLKKGSVVHKNSTRAGKVLYFAGCYATHINPGISRAAVRVLTAMGFDVKVPEQGCCGIPMFSKGMAAKAGRAVLKNLTLWGGNAVEADYIITTCSSCLYALLNYWDMTLNTQLPTAQKDLVKTIAEKTTHISTLVSQNMDRLTLLPQESHLAYHTPCHFKGTAHAQSSIQMLSSLPGLTVLPLTTHCCGMAGTWGMLADNYDLSQRIGSDLKGQLSISKATTAATDCPTCRMQMEAFSLQPVYHPVEILRQHLEP